jgi:hypothetical protein
MFGIDSQIAERVGKFCVGQTSPTIVWCHFDGCGTSESNFWEVALFQQCCLLVGFHKPITQ